MARNFFGETANFFLRGRDYTTLRSGRIVNNKVTFKKGTVYGSRFKLRRTMQTLVREGTSANARRLRGRVQRLYQFDRDAWGSKGIPSAYSQIGGKYFSPIKGAFLSGAAYELPQDPIHPWYAQRTTFVDGATGDGTTAGSEIDIDYASPGRVARESFTMYSRPTAFGPPVSGRILTDKDSAASASLYGIKDSLDGYNWSFTPPYYHGEAWMDLVFRPTKPEYTLEEILEEIETQCWRVDPGPEVAIADNINPTPAYISSSLSKQCINDGRNVNMNAMQVTASMNMFGIEKETFLETDQYGNPTAQRNETKATRWVIKPKYETPMLNFNSYYRRIDPISGSMLGNDTTTLTLPLFGSASVPIGMWHQFGIIEPDRNTGIFMEMGNIPKDWLKYHYSVRHTASIYNGQDADDFDAKKAENVFAEMRSLTDVFKFEKTPQRLGEIARRKVIREAIVAIPYRNVVAELAPIDGSDRFRTEKQFFGLEPFRVAAALAANAKSAAGQDLDVAGESIRKLVRKMKRYILPPQFDFLRNPAVPPIAMYLFEFRHTLDKDDLSYIWQNLAPRDYQKLRFEESSIAHELNSSEILDAEDLMQDDTQWMIFKVKQKATGDYFKHVASQIGESKITTQDHMLDIANESLQYNTDFVENTIDAEQGNGVINQNTYNLQYNWPYDYVSIVEGIKIDIEVMYTDKIEQTSNIIAEEIDAQQQDATEATNIEMPNPSQVATQIAQPIVQQQAVKSAMVKLNMVDDDDDDPPSSQVGFNFGNQGGGNQGGGNQGGGNQGGGNQGGGNQGGGNY
jgi:hypothetical protein